MELGDYLRIVRRHWRAILACALAAVLVAAVYTLARPKVFRADAAGFVASGTANSAAESSISDSLAKSRVASYVVVAKSRGTAEAAAKIIGSDEPASALIARVNVSQPPDTVLIQVSAEGASPTAASDLANAWIEALALQVEGIEGKGTGAMRVVPQESAAVPTAPISPNPRRELPLALVLGLFAGLVVAVVRSQLDRRLRTPSDVREHGFTVLTSVPATKALDRSKGRIPLLSSGRGASADPAAGEAVRRLRTNLRYMNVDNPPRVIVVTSPNEGDGKSTVASNLAGTMAASGTPTVLVDADLRRPVIAGGLGVAEGAGLTDVLTGEAEIEDVMQEAGDGSGLVVIGAGNIPPNPSELLGTRAMKSFVSQLAEDYLIIIDAPPVLPVTDAAVLGTIADGVILVVSAGKTLDTHINGAADQLAEVNARLLGVVLNRVAKKEASAYFGGPTRYHEARSAPEPASESEPEDGRRSRARGTAASTDELPRRRAGRSSADLWEG
jgi:capsular exopolysaccharide synthesis family protein